MTPQAKVKQAFEGLGRILLWVFPCLFAGPNPYHGYDIVFNGLIPGIWVVGAIVGICRNPEKLAKAFYAIWLVCFLALAYWHYILPRYA